MQKRSNRLALRVLSTATFLAMVSSCTTAAFADTYDLTKGSVTVNAKSDGISYVTQTDSDGKYVYDNNHELHDYKDETPVTLTTSGEEPTHNTASIYTEKGVSTTVTLDNVNIDASGTDKAAIDTKGNVTLELDGNNTLIGGTDHAALEKYSTASNNVPDQNYTLTLQDGNGKTGSLTATGGEGGAGIGGDATDRSYANNITITGGNITAIGGKGAAGIGGGKANNESNGNGSSITISGENTTVNATGGAGGAGIGGGKGGDGSKSGQGFNIKVEDGAHVEATGGEGGAGIGGGKGGKGFGSGLGSLITITGEGTTVTATGGKDGAGIGGGKGGAGGSSGQGYIIKVGEGAHVEATGGAGGAGSRSGQGNGITIQNGAHVEATGNGSGAGIGGGDGSKGTVFSGLGKDITITGEGTTVNATGGATGSGIGGGQDGQGYLINVTDGAQVEATGGAEGGAGIGGGKKTGNYVYAGSGNTITISGKTTQVTATGKGGGAGIGGGSSGYGSKITVNDGTVTASGGAGGAGIGGGNGGSGQNITVTGGIITANGSAGGAGIGGGKGTAASVKSGGNGVTITDGTVTATGGKGAAGIGSGADSRWKLGSFVDITGGTVTATGGAGEAAGIGNGENDAGTSTVKISATNAALDVTAVTQGSGEAITGENGVTMASLTNDRSGVVRFFRSKNHYNTVHNGKYVGMDDNNADEHKKTDAHIWDSAKDEILQQATPAVRGIVRHHCGVDGCKGYYEEPFDYVAPAPTDPDTPDVPGTSDVTPGTPAQGTPDVPGTSDVAPDAPAQDTPDVPGTLDVTPDAPADAVAGAAAAKEVSVTPSRAQSIIAAALPQTGVNWLVAAVGSALSGMFLLAVGFVLKRKSRGQN